jgi:hypothetical protein
MSTLCAYDYPAPDYWWTEPCDLWREGKVRARKRYSCCECGGSIEVGELHGVAKQLCDHQWFTDRRCPACLILAELVATILRECPLWRGLEETIDEQVTQAGHELPSPREHRRLWDAAGQEAPS